MEKIADRVRQRMSVLGLTEDIVAGSCHTSQPTINRLLNGKTKNPPYIYELAKALETSVKWLKTGIEESVTSKNSNIPQVVSIPQSGNRYFPLNDHDLIPMYGAVSASSPEIVHFTEEYMIEEVPRHPSVQKVKGAFAMQVSGDSMAPRHRPGERVYIHPYQVPSIGQDCIIVQEPDGNALLKQFMGETLTEWKFSQLNPFKELSISKADVRKIFAVVR